MLTTILDALSATPERPARSACVPEMSNNARIIITADSDYVPSAPGHEGGGLGQRWRSTITFARLRGPRLRRRLVFLLRSPKECFMVHRNNAGKLLLFPASTAVPDSPADNWSLRILKTKDNLTSALEFLRIAYNEMLAGRPVKSVDEVLARVEAILRNDAKVPAYTLVAAIRIHGSISPEPKRRVPLLFPAV
jgi:hypothetical protein